MKDGQITNVDQIERVLSNDEIVVTPYIPAKAQGLAVQSSKSNTKQDKIAFPKEDNWSKFGYDLRYLDAIASLFHVATDCAAAIEYKGKIYISYNSTLSGKTKLLDIRNLTLIRIANMKDSSEKAQDSILGLYLLNESFVDLVEEGERICKKYSKITESTNALKNFISIRMSVLSMLEKESNPDVSSITKELIDQYFKILECVDSDTTLASHKESYLRPLQDALKLYHHIIKVPNYLG